MRFSRFFVAILVLAVSTLAAHADTYQFTVYNAASGITSGRIVFDTLTFTLPSAPIPSSFDQNSFYLNDVKAISSGQTHDEVVGFGKFGNQYEFGIGTAGVSLKDNSISAGSFPSAVIFSFQSLYLGSTSSPTFALGDFMSVDGAKAMSITNLSDTSSVPEPSALVLFGTGILGLAGAARKKLFG